MFKKERTPFINAKVNVTVERTCSYCGEVFENTYEEWALIFDFNHYETSVKAECECPNCKMLHDGYDDTFVVKNIVTCDYLNLKDKFRPKRKIDLINVLAYTYMVVVSILIFIILKNIFK